MVNKTNDNTTHQDYSLTLNSLPTRPVIFGYSQSLRFLMGTSSLIFLFGFIFMAFWDSYEIYWPLILFLGFSIGSAYSFYKMSESIVLDRYAVTLKRFHKRIRFIPFSEVTMVVSKPGSSITIYGISQKILVGKQLDGYEYFYQILAANFPINIERLPATFPLEIRSSYSLFFAPGILFLLSTIFLLGEILQPVDARGNFLASISFFVVGAIMFYLMPTKFYFDHSQIIVFKLGRRKVFSMDDLQFLKLESIQGGNGGNIFGLFHRQLILRLVFKSGKVELREGMINYPVDYLYNVLQNHFRGQTEQSKTPSLPM
ncbi:MAG: hypothetical protein H6662_04530 [Ardenticatenaceae bacterium]|nr:hypothetical protein [Ardenticatenaceae bacterium]MCB8991653.1 hypothetical protein [Ardenticatenaceae bacterium]MCB9002751.1 hypothetical protein [Ardenticatenaceae bacterium]